MMHSHPSKIAMRIIINESLLKEKKTSETYFGNRESGGGGGPYDARFCNA